MEQSEAEGNNRYGVFSKRKMKFLSDDEQSKTDLGYARLDIRY